MKILLLAHFYPPEIGGAAARLHGLARWMAADGHDVTVIAGFPNYPGGQIPEQYRGKFRSLEELDGVRLIRTWVYATPKRGAIRRLANYFSFMFTSFLAGVFTKQKFHVVVASCPPLFIGMSGWAISKLRRARFVFDIRDLWPDVAVEAGEFAEDDLITRMGHWLAGFIYRRSDHIIPVTQNKRKRLLDKGVDQSKLSVVTNGVDLDLIPDLSTQPTLRDELKLNGKFVAIYAGLLGIAQRVEIVAEAAAILKNEPDLHFVLVGDGVRRPEIEKIICDESLENVTMLPRQPREKMPAILATADLCLVPLATANLTDAVPSKLLEAWSYRKPVILVAAGEAASLVEESSGGKVVEPGDAKGLAEEILNMKNNSKDTLASGLSGFEYVQANLDRPLLARQFAQVLESVVHST